MHPKPAAKHAVTHVLGPYAGVVIPPRPALRLDLHANGAHALRLEDPIHAERLTLFARTLPSADPSDGPRRT